ncbi:dihydrodipicolinate synthase family protein [Metabacillus sp. Hm71]|uniref:dihydrodipicolinate synthase family protein n=1 Tax=Metabacillus sp. Hm71 TaxID=3450743 RepID=UPI003F43560F
MFLIKLYFKATSVYETSIMIYNFPDRTINISPELVLRLALDFPNIVAIKDTVDSISLTRRLIRL